jgi:CIC family chloride channel protein
LLYESVRKQIQSGEIRKYVLLGLFIGVIAGLGAIAIYYSIDLATKYILTGITGVTVPGTDLQGTPSTFKVSSAFVMPGFKELLIPLSTTLGGLGSGFLVYKFAPEAEGHGTDAAIDAFHNKEGEVRRRIPLIKMVASALTIGSGGSAGREGPTAQIAAGFGSFVADFFKLGPRDRRIAVAAGIGAGIGSIFMAPLGGALLSSEILYRRDFEVDALIPSIIASVVGYSIFGYLFDYKPMFTIPANTIIGFYHPASLLLYLGIGIIAGLTGIGYVRMFYGMQSVFRRMPKIPKMFKPAIGGLAVGVIAMFFPEVMGLGYGWIQQLFLNPYYFPLTILLVLVFVKMVATAFTIGSGGSGGVFAPGFVIGAFLGGFLAIIFQPAFPYLTDQEIIIVTMIAFFGGISNAPLSVIIMGTEMTQSYLLFIPLMLATITSYFVKGRQGIYRSQVENRAESNAHREEYERPVMDQVRVYDAVKKDYLSVSPDMPILEAVSRLRESRTKSVIVVKDGIYLGYLSIEELPFDQGLRNLTVRELMTEQPGILIEASDNIHSAMDRLSKLPVGKLVVVESMESRRVTGTLGFNEIADAYNREIRRIKEASSMRPRKGV